MNEQAASAYATQFAERWPGSVLASVDAPPKRADEQGYVVRVTIPRRNRVLRLTSEKQAPGIIDVCAELLDFKTEARTTVIEQREPQESEVSPEPPAPARTLLNEEEAAAYLGIKQNTLRTYVANKTLREEEVGLFLLEDLRIYKEVRDARWSKPRKLTPGQTAAAKSDPPGEAQLLQQLIAHVFTETPGITGLGRLSEAPRSWKVDVTTEHGPESYRVTRLVDGLFQQERW